MNDRLQEFHNWLTENCGTYISMIANGSNATGDTWIEGRSDHDVLLVFSTDFHGELERIKDYLKKSSFTDEYLFVPFSKEGFIKSHNSTHDFSRKFRTKTLFGQDLISEVQLPTKEQIYALYSKGLDDFMNRFERRLLNTSFWSEKKVRSIFWQFFKEAIMYLQIKHYYETGVYPRTRDELVQSYNAPELVEILAILKKINEAGKDSIIQTAEKLFQYLGQQRKAV